MTDFYQDGPRLGNQYADDATLRAYVRRTLPPPVLAEVEPDLERLGARAAGEILALGDAAEREPPRHVPFDAWGRRVDRVEVSDAWRQLGRIAAEEGLVAIGYERARGALSRVEQFARLYLFSASSATYTCPLAMSDGAARVIELHGDDELRRTAFRRLTSRDPDDAWTSGQWMTERTGGSDVGCTATTARRDGEGFRLYGTKWFTSATTSQMAMTLARIEGAPAGSKGLSLFHLELRDETGALEDIRIHRLKDKLGTRALPTAELSLEGTPARLVGGEGEGIKRIAALLNITRLYNACAAVSGMRRALVLARDYAKRRVAFGHPLAELPAHAETLAALAVECDGAFHLLFRAIELLGREECGEASEAERALLRLLTPVAKLYTGKQAVTVASEAIECFGGAGYIEDTGLPRLLRDAQVLPIWEGTTNVLSLDVLRAIEKGNALEAFRADVAARLDGVRGAELSPAVARARRASHALAAHYDKTVRRNEGSIEAGARAFAFGLARTYAASLLLEHAAWSLASDEPGARRAVAAARRWCAQDLAPILVTDEEHLAETAALIGY